MGTIKKPRGDEWKTVTNGWIEVTTRPLTEEEKEYYSGLSPRWDDITFMYDCQLPGDGQEVLITDKYGNVQVDTFIRDDVDGCYFEYNCDEGDVIAWMSLPKPFRKEN